MRNKQLPTFVAQKIDINGTHLVAYVDGLSQSTLLKKFPEGRMEGYYDPTKGYEDDDVGFVCVETGEIFNVYSRWGSVRIGALDNSETVQHLIRFLCGVQN